MFSDPQFWVAAAFIVFVLVIFNPIRKILTSSLDLKINEIKNNIQEAENLKNETKINLSDLKKKEEKVISEIEKITSLAKEKIKNLENITKEKLNDQIPKKKIYAKRHLIFWKGHVAYCLNQKNLIHAYGPKKRVLIMDIKKTINEIEKKSKLIVKGIRKLDVI